MNNSYTDQNNSILFDIEKKLIKEKPVPDGIVNPKIWLEHTLKLLFVLKDTNRQKDSIADLLNDPFNPKNESGIKDSELRKNKNISNLRKTWLNIARWSYGFNRIAKNNQIDDWSEIDQSSDWYNERDDKNGWLGELKNIAVINLKKTPGESTAKHAELLDAANKYGNYIWDQIDLIKADVVVFCSVSEYLVDDKQTNWKETTKGYWYFKTKDTIYIKFWHPNAHFPHNMMFFALMKIITEINKDNQ